MKRRRSTANPVKPDAPALRPISVRIPAAVQITGISRTKLYELIKSGDLQIVKVGSATLIPVETLQRFIDINKS